MRLQRGRTDSKQLFLAVVEREPSERASFLRNACGQDEGLHVEVASLLSAYEASNAIAEDRWPHRSPDVAADDLPDLGAIGPYRLLRKLGEGGMGEVWLAEQTAPVQRRVALKLVRQGRSTDSLLPSFQSERQLLAIMDHPGIAKVFEAGSTADGLPYLAMEYVDGLPLTDYCDRRRMGIPDRLELFIKVCEAVQHAHQKAIIHRDLKPANILVVDVDNKPVPRIIDFGLAKAATPLVDQTDLAFEGRLWGTPAYMSPEQAVPCAQDVDTRTDVYSLGVVLYVLLSGSLPFDPREWRKLPLSEVLRQLREEDPPRPSAKFARAKMGMESTAVLRGTKLGQLKRELEGDLDRIVMKAMDKDRARRYGTPSELAADIGRYLRNEPVTARPACTRYRVQKYLRRHRIGVAVTTGFVWLLAGFAIVQGFQLRKITRERDRADRVTEFMSGMFKVSNPGEDRGNTITAREILDQASRNVDSGLTRDPELQAQTMYEMGTVYKNLGLYDRAGALLTQSAQIRSRVLGSKNPDTLRAMNGLAKVVYLQGRYSESERLFREALAVRLRVLGPDHPDTLQSQSDLAENLSKEGRYFDAERIRRDTLRIRRRILGPEHPQTLDSMNNLTLSLEEEGRFADAEKMWRQILVSRSRVQGAEHPATLDAMSNLALDLEREDQIPEAESLQRETLELRRRVLGREHPDTLDSMSNLARALGREGRYADAEKLLRETMDVERRVLGPEHPDTLHTASDLAATLSYEGRYDDAEKLQRETIDVRCRVLGPEAPDTLQSLAGLSTTLGHEARYDEAEKLLDETLRIQRRLFGPDNPQTVRSVYNLACLKAIRGKREEALNLLQESVDHGMTARRAQHMEKDADLKSLLGDPRFSLLVKQAKERTLQKAN